MFRIKQLTTARLTRGKGVNPKTGAEDSAYRISMKFRLGDDHEVVQMINQKLEATSGLSMETSNLPGHYLQVVNYGLGGFVEPHFDFIQEDQDATIPDCTGNRIAT